MKRKIGKLLMILGGLLIAASLVLTAYNIWDSWRADSAAQKTVDKIEAEIGNQTEGLADGAVPLYKQFPDMEMPVKMIDGYAYIGILEVPSKNLKLPVMEEWDYTRLRISPCRYSGSIYTKDMVIAGHNYLRHFTPIKQLKAGDTVIFTDMDGNRFEYKVGWTEVIEPEDIEKMTSETEDNTWDLTLFTCTYGGGSRFTVRCLLDDDWK